MPRTKTRNDGKTRKKFATLLREDLYLALHEIRVNRLKAGRKDDIYMLIEEAIDDYVGKNLKDKGRKTT